MNTNHHLSFNIFIHPLPIVNTTNHPFPITSLQLQCSNHHIFTYNPPNYILPNKPTHTQHLKLMNPTHLKNFIINHTNY
ncbi:two-component system activity regulator YycH, partial [Bacillus altitudinis]|uniref:two-component system activity regulator YycH n=1 Tax=Bacillus altitudinis TaxID=293387 RepID=UPI003B52AB4C